MLTVSGEWRAFLEEILKKETLDQDCRDRLTGIIGYVAMVYQDDLPRSIRDPYLTAKKKFGIGDRRERSHYYDF